ncbi:MAG TPA: hypothetical protein VF414_02650 [Thermoanaerobaculia bacterium]
MPSTRGGEIALGYPAASSWSILDSFDDPGAGGRGVMLAAKARAHARAVAVHPGQEPQPSAHLPRRRQADQPARLARHEVDRGRRDVLGQHGDVA